jgi:hypothetical protein
MGRLPLTRKARAAKAREALIEAQERERDRLRESCALADAEDTLAEARCAQLLEEFARSAQRFSSSAVELAAVTEAGRPPREVASAASSLETARAALSRDHRRIVDEWAAITQSRLVRARRLSEEVSKVCATTMSISR